MSVMFLLQFDLQLLFTWTYTLFVVAFSFRPNSIFGFVCNVYFVIDLKGLGTEWWIIYVYTHDGLLMLTEWIYNKKIQEE